MRTRDATFSIVSGINRVRASNRVRRTLVPGPEATGAGKQQPAPARSSRYPTQAAGAGRRDGGTACEDDPVTSAVLDEALKKAAVAWVSVDDGPAVALWCLPADGGLAIVSGPGEQDAPGLDRATHATVRLRGDHGGLIVTAEMTVERLNPGSDQWATLVPQLAGKRLNAAGPVDEVVARWVDTGCAIVRLVPAERVVTAPDLPTASGAAPPRDSPARVPARRPFRLHRVRRPAP